MQSEWKEMVFDKAAIINQKESLSKGKVNG